MPSSDHTAQQRALALLLVLSWVTYPAKDIIITVQNGFMTESKPTTVGNFC